MTENSLLEAGCMIGMIGYILLYAGLMLHYIQSHTPYILTLRHSNEYLCAVGIHSFIEGDGWFDTHNNRKHGGMPQIRVKECTTCGKTRYGKYYWPVSTEGEDAHWEWRDEPKWFYWDI